MDCLRQFRSDIKGATAVEFAMVSSVLVLTLLFIMMVATILYMQQALDYATSKAARQVMIGTVQGAAMSQSDFRTTVVCTFLPAAFTCPNVIVNLQTATEAISPGGYYAYVKSDVSGLIVPALSNASAQFSAGSQSSYEYLQVIYPVTFLPTALASILSGGVQYNGTSAYLIVSTAAFKNEQY